MQEDGSGWLWSVLIYVNGNGNIH